MTLSEHCLRTYDSIVQASARIKHQVLKTPLLYSRSLSALNGGKVFLKCENLQHTGSFKFRGGSNALLSLSKEQRDGAGVVAYSSGNHAQGIACAASLLGVKASIVMPSDAPQVKIDNCKRLGAQIVLYDRYAQDRDAIGAEMSKNTGAELVKPFDDHRVISGQGTCGLEIVEQCGQMDIKPDSALVCCGGGGLSAGVGTAMKYHFPQVKLFLAEPENFEDAGRSLMSGQIEVNDPAARSICDAIVTPSPGTLTFPILKACFAGGLAVKDAVTRHAIKHIFDHHRMVAEPGGAIAVACFMANAKKFLGQTVVVTISGGNIDAAMLSDILTT